MDRETWESMAQADREEWVRFQAWKQQRDGDRQAVARDQSGHGQLRHSTSRRVVLVGVIALLVVLGVLASFGANTTMTGRITVATGTSALSSSYSSYGSNGGRCVTYRGYDDIAEGVSVTVRDSGGAIAGVGHLGAGRPEPYGCTFPFTVADLPSSEFYTVEISHRGEVTFTADDVAAGDVHLSLG
ncbi:hypothetical protein H7X46_27720 [Pseudonocardia sp. C8]|uniref:hypothetical protein n=1 Tax=Pseudonocardia sp. C8 TaxID=2762759 RepID=UPI001642A57C|nr:hypothetical protein [Pseudonocardia sp. C8]MBC3194845.1 hypothetical protein [Pseudonocardia sp. C8]